MISFHQPSLEDREWILPLVGAAEKLNCEYTFANMFLWSSHGRIACIDGYLVVRYPGNNTANYLFPCGPKDGPLLQVLDKLVAQAESEGLGTCFYGMSQEEAQMLCRHFAGRFHCRPSRNHFDYLYEIDRLADLRGKKLQAKRNHINRFQENHPDWHVEPLTREWMPQVRAFLENWYANHAEPGKPGHDYAAESFALNRAIENYEQLELEGLALIADGRLMAFTMGSPIRDTAFDIHFEKADPEIQGSYPLINREFARYLREKYPSVTMLNREDDMGLPGLRQAKESYYPDLLLEKYIGEMEGYAL